MYPYLGEIRIFLKHKIPKSYMECDGSEVFIDEYPRLYMTIGNRFGGDEKTRFKLPNMIFVGDANIVYCIAYEGIKRES